MDCFGVEELATSKSVNAPGWAYVPDTGINASVAALQPTSRKRARGPLSQANNGDTTAKQDAKILRELAHLDRESHRDVHIPVPVRYRDNAGRVSHGKVTPAVRKILQSQKTFANHLSDFEAFAALGVSSHPHPNQYTVHAPPTSAAPSSTAAPVATGPHLTSTGKRSHKKKDPSQLLRAQPSRSTPLRHVSTVGEVSSSPAPSPISKPGEAFSIASNHAGANTTSSIKLQPFARQPPPHPMDDNPLLKSRIPAVPSTEELEKLLAEKPLSYPQARAELGDEEQKRAQRVFCEVCGYWGRVKCLRCGARVCALECMRTHQEDCFARYGA